MCNIRSVLSLFVALFVISYGKINQTPTKEQINNIAQEFVMLSFQLGEHDKDFVDAYFGPDSLRKQALSKKISISDIVSLADSLNKKILFINSNKNNIRLNRLSDFVIALKTRAEIINGKKIPFDEESKLIYNCIPPYHSDTFYDNILLEIDSLIPGTGDLDVRYSEYRKAFIIPADKLNIVFRTAIDSARERTKNHIKLLPGENFKIEFVKGVSWGAYNWFKGNSFSLIQVNTDVPTYIDQAIGLASHEGYPGHHVYHSLIEKMFYKDSNWVEYSIYPLFSPQSVISEGTANYGVSLAFPDSEKIEFEKKYLFPLAGLDTSMASKYYRILKLINRLKYAGIDVARSYLDGKLSREDAIIKLMKYQLRTRERAEMHLKFIEQYRAYIINYVVGEDLVKNYVEKKAGENINLDKLWDSYHDLITTQYISPSEMQSNK